MGSGAVRRGDVATRIVVRCHGGRHDPAGTQSHQPVRRTSMVTSTEAPPATVAGRRSEVSTPMWGTVPWSPTRHHQLARSLVVPILVAGAVVVLLSAIGRTAAAAVLVVVV
ncbi:hypothetical protein B7486_76870, partial [cyanobacterium TDX16]